MCGKDKPITEFYPAKNGRGYAYRCKECSREAVRANRAKVKLERADFVPYQAKRSKPKHQTIPDGAEWRVVLAGEAGREVLHVGNYAESAAYFRTIPLPAHTQCVVLEPVL